MYLYTYRILCSKSILAPNKFYCLAAIIFCNSEGKDPELSQNTLIILSSDNGPDAGVNKAGNLKGYKTQLYDGGIRTPFISWYPAVMPDKFKGTVNSKTVLSAIDLLPSLAKLAGVKDKDFTEIDGVDLSEVIIGTSKAERKKPLFWIRPPDRPGLFGANDPDLAIRKGDFKLLMDVNGSNVQLYNIKRDKEESREIKTKWPDKVEELKNELLNWYQNYPHHINQTIYEKNL